MAVNLLEIKRIFGAGTGFAFFAGQLGLVFFWRQPGFAFFAGQLGLVFFWRQPGFAFFAGQLGFPR
jgi:hypothetical protein